MGTELTGWQPLEMRPSMWLQLGDWHVPLSGEGVTWLNGMFNEVIFGWQSFSPAPANDVWMDDIVLSERITGVPVAVIRTPYIEKMGLSAGPISRWLLKHRRTKHYMRSMYALRSLWQLKRASLDTSEAAKEYWQAGKSVDGKAVNSSNLHPMEEALIEVGLTAEKYIYFTPWLDEAISPGERLEILNFPNAEISKPTADHIRAVLPRIRVHVLYCSIYEQHFELVGGWC